MYSFSGDTHSSIALYILSLFIDQVSSELVQSCCMITVLSDRSIVFQDINYYQTLIAHVKRKVDVNAPLRSLGLSSVTQKGLRVVYSLA